MTVPEREIPVNDLPEGSIAVRPPAGAAREWLCRGRVFRLGRPLVMGILNVTPDSFSDGGMHAALDEAVAWGRKLLEDGADIIDVGGESTRPGSLPVPSGEQVRRVVPVVEALSRLGAAVSVDTSDPEVMRRSLDAGAVILNDIRAFSVPGALDVAAGSGAGLVVMHMKGTPETMQQDPGSADIVSEVEDFLSERDRALVEAGADPRTICWDPGFGFGKTVEENFVLVREIPRLLESGRPVLMGVSRKSSIGAVTGVAEPARRIFGSVACALACAARGAAVLRVHDVRETVEALRVLEAVEGNPLEVLPAS